MAYSTGGCHVIVPPTNRHSISSTQPNKSTFLDVKNEFVAFINYFENDLHPQHSIMLNLDWNCSYDSKTTEWEFTYVWFPSHLLSKMKEQGVSRYKVYVANDVNTPQGYEMSRQAPSICREFTDTDESGNYVDWESSWTLV